MCDAADMGQGRQSQGKKVSIPAAGTAMVLRVLNGHTLFTKFCGSSTPYSKDVALQSTAAVVSAQHTQLRFPVRDWPWLIGQSGEGGEQSTLHKVNLLPVYQ